MLSPPKLLLLILLSTFSLVACGPETIVLRSGIDTPGHHLENGYKLLKRGKLEAAFNEFSRARELDAQNSQAYVGLGLVYAHQGNFQRGLYFLTTAKELAQTKEDFSMVNEGFKRYDLLKSKHESNNASDSQTFK